ncbi:MULTISPECIES: hypothetical protein [unclassified Rhizobacter]|uniref:hypothetical protein n=1 Tax=unclassified Rhizobacter TaxID=2640088 RepID=UPI0006F81449|nr:MULTISPECIES: hypothetical protein [unclassified Rhizobacter]KQU80935.1 hypothetical protein ASC88_15485 [Rhizobacter sp. Root29]KQW04478.1 hypothetical protein ASC98_05175 [Rhizobacter sp. Root1238]
MSDTRTLTDADMQRIAEKLAAQLVTQLGDERTAQRLVDVWGGYVDRQLGKGLRRFAMYAVMALLGLGAIKFDWFSRLLSK